MVSDQEILNLKNKHGDMYKVVLSYYKAATVEIQFNGKHIGFMPSLLFKDDCWRIWLGRYLEIGTVLTQKCGDNPCLNGMSSARISAV